MPLPIEHVASSEAEHTLVINPSVFHIGPLVLKGLSVARQGGLMDKTH